MINNNKELKKMNATKTCLSLFILYFFLSLQGSGQSTSIYIATDKPFYSVDEHIYFKVYLKAETPSEPTSAPLFVVHLIDQKKNIINSQLFTVTKNSGSGELLLPDSIEGGSYNLIAYDENIGPSNSFGQKQIEIINPFRRKIHPAFDLPSMNPKKEIESVIYFPEGGDLLTGVTTRVGFKVIDKNGNGIETKGILENADGAKISDVTTKDTGFGSFILKSENSKAYKIRFTLPDSTSKGFDLPEPKEPGILLSIRDSLENFLSCKIQSTNRAYSEKFFLNILSDGNVRYSEMIDLEEGKGIKNLLKKNIPLGLIKFSIENKDKQIIKEVYYLHDDQYFPPIISLPKHSFAAQEKVEIEIHLDPRMKADSANLSISVIDKNQVDQRFAPTLLNDFIYHSKLKELIVPEFYNSILYNITYK
jgi:hypothetical protein